MSSRRLEILRAIVDEYVATQEPVGSKAIAERHGLGISCHDSQRDGGP